jgi:hypothetical protein
LKRNAVKPLYDAAGGTVLPERSDVDFVLFMPGDHFEIVDDDAFDEASVEDRLATAETSVARVPAPRVHVLRHASWLELDDVDEDPLPSEYDTGAHFDRAQARAYDDVAPYESHAACGLLEIDDELVETTPEPQLDEDITRVRHRVPEGTWWEAAKRGLRALATTARPYGADGPEPSWWQAARRGLRVRPD